MRPEDISALIQAEIADGWNADDPAAYPHGLDLARCLLSKPELRSYLDSFDENRPVEMWLVLVDDPVGHGKYEIVYDETRGAFGLALSAPGRPVIIGYHGSFRETIAGM